MAHKIEIEGVIGWHDKATANHLSEGLKAANGGPVKIYINSPGGLVGEGLRMFNMIRGYAGHTTAVLSGYAMSMASYIPQACDVVEAEDNAVYMIHNARGGVWGDHNEILKYGNYVKGLSGISAKLFSKVTARRGKAKSVEEITEMMDAETFLFGDEMVENGFVDAIIETDNSDDDSATAFAGARAAFSEAMALMAGDQQRVKMDLQLAMQLCDVDPVQVTTPAAPAAGTNKQEVQQIMGLKELLAANPAAQAEYDQAIASAKAAGAAGMQETVKACAPFLNNPAYPKQVGEMAVKVMTGEQAKGNLDLLVATADMLKESTASAAAAAGSEAAAAAGLAPQTPAAPATPVGLITDDATSEAEVAKLKGGA